MKKYNIFNLNVEKDEPSIQNEHCRLWLLDKDKEFIIFKAICTNGFNGFTLFDKRGPIYDSESYESVCIRRDVEKRLRK